jgi:hypothetical protein
VIAMRESSVRRKRSSGDMSRLLALPWREGRFA